MRLRIALIAPLVLACGLAGPGVSNPPTAGPTPEATLTEAPTLAPTAPPTAAPTDSPPTDALEGPPDGLLAADGDPVAGQLGSFCWGDTCADGPFPRKDQLPILEASAGSELTLALGDETEFVDWSAVYAARSNDGGTELGTGEGPATTATFSSPPGGDWVIRVFVRFSDGDASYAWHVSVP